MTETIENPTAENPAADQLEAGGTISGTYRKLPFTDETLYDDNGVLFIADGVPIRHVNGNLGRHVTVTSYTQPEPKPWWETCTGNTWVRCVDIAGEVLVLSAHRFRKQWVTAEARAARNPRRVLIADADTEVVVPRALINGFRDELSRSDTYLTHMLKLGDDLLAAVDERGDHAD